MYMKQISGIITAPKIALRSALRLYTDAPPFSEVTRYPGPAVFNLP